MEEGPVSSLHRVGCWDLDKLGQLCLGEGVEVGRSQSLFQSVFLTHDLSLDACERCKHLRDGQEAWEAFLCRQWRRKQRLPACVCPYLS